MPLEQPENNNEVTEKKNTIHSLGKWTKDDVTNYLG